MRTTSPLLLRGPTYFQDRCKAPSAHGARGELLWVDLVETDQRWDHVCAGQVRLLAAPWLIPRLAPCRLL